MVRYQCSLFCLLWKVVGFDLFRETFDLFLCNLDATSSASRHRGEQHLLWRASTAPGL